MTWVSRSRLALTIGRTSAFEEFSTWERTGRPAALKQSKHGVLVASATLGFEALFAANIGFVHLDDASSAAHRSKSAVAHRFADAVSQEPSGFHAANEHPLDL